MSQLVGPGAIAVAGPTSQTWTTPFPHRPGDKARDVNGNEFVFCTFVTTNVSGGVLVSIDASYNAAPLLGTETGARRVGVAMTGATAGTDGGWVQIYGYHLGVQTSVASDTDAGSSNLTSLAVLIPQTSVTTPSGTLALVAVTASASSGSSTLANEIFGMWLAGTNVSNIVGYSSGGNSDDPGADSSALSTDTSGVTTNVATTNGTSMLVDTIAVGLNYPHILNQAREVNISGTSTSDQ